MRVRDALRHKADLDTLRVFQKATRKKYAPITREAMQAIVRQVIRLANDSN